MLLFLFLLSTTPEFEAPIASENIAEELQTLRDNPLPINSAKKQDLIRIYWITPELAKSIIKARTKSGGFKKIEELKQVDGMTDEIFDLITPYITIDTPKSKSDFSTELRQRLQGELPEEQIDSSGSPLKTYARLKTSYKNISSAALLEKDYYEKSFYDLATAGVMIKKIGIIEKLMIGDYILDFGEGLLFGIPPLATFKTQGVIKNKSQGIKLNTGSGENTFLRGTTVELKLTNAIKNYIFLANTPMDGKVEDGEVTVYYDYEGTHSTASGIAKKDRIKEELLGTRVEYTDKIKAGATIYRNTYYLNPEGNKSGMHNLFSIDLSVHIQG